jgi:carboxymethylenebutenolidase
MLFYRGMTCENVTIKGDQGTPITAYVAKPSGPGPFPGVVLVHHLPGWSEFYIETTRRFAHHGYLAICANLYERAGQGNPDDVAAKVRADGGIPDAQMVGDTEAAVKWMRAQPNLNGKVGLFGSCSGGRHAFIYACQKKDVDACVELWGGRVVMGKEELNAKTPVAPIDMTKDLCCPLLGIFGNDDRAPSPEQVNQHEAELKKLGKVHEFYRYDGAATASSTGTGRSIGPSRQWMAGARYSPSSASIWLNRRVRTCARPSSRSHARKAWQSAGTNGSRFRRRWSPMTMRAMRRWATSSRSISSTLASNPGHGLGLS